MPLKITKDDVAEFKKLVQKLTSKQVLVGITEDNADRGDSEINNAAIGYIMENGCPEKNIPARPHLVPGLRETVPRAITILKTAAKKTLTLEGRQDPEIMEKAMMKIGMIAVGNVQKIILAKIPPPLADSTLKARAARAGNSKKGISIAKGAIAELEMRTQLRATFGPEFMPASVNVTPLVDSGEYLHKITYVVRDRTK